MFEIKDCDNEMLQTVEAYSSDLKNIRTGRVSPDIMKSVIVDSYDGK